MEGTEEIVLEVPVAGLEILPDVLLYGLVADHHAVLLCKGLELDHQIGGMAHIDEKDAEEHADEEGEGQIPDSQSRAPST